MQELGRLEDLPEDYRAALTEQNLVPLWPSRLGDVLRGRGEFRVFPVPFELPEYEVKQHWHERFHHDDGNRWLRRLIAQLLAEG